MGVYKMLVLNCQKMLEINCHFLLESTCRLHLSRILFQENEIIQKKARWQYGKFRYDKTVKGM